MNKKGMFGVNVSLSTVLGVIIMLTVLLVFGRILFIFYTSSPDQSCRSSAIAASASTVGGKQILLSFSCPRRYWGFGPGIVYEYEEGKIEDKKTAKRASGSLEWTRTIEGTGVGGSGKEEVLKNLADALTGQLSDTTGRKYSPSEQEQLSRRLLDLQRKEDIRTYDQQDFMNGFIADRMFRCVEKLGAGSFTLFDAWYGKIPKTRNFCVICDAFDFHELHEQSSDLGVQDVSTLSTVSTLDEWMRLWTIPKKDMTYYAYLQDVNLQKETMWQQEYDYKTDADEFVIIYTEALDNAALQVTKGIVRTITWPVRALASQDDDSVDEKKTKAKAVLFIEKGIIPDVCDYVVN